MMNMTPLHKPVAGVLSALFLAGALSGCAESDFDKARKPELIDRAVATSLYKCDLQESKPQEIPYEARLRIVLADADSVALDKLEEHGIAVCLDQRLNHQKRDFLDMHIRGVFYAEAKIMTLRDNGRNPATQRWYETDIRYRAGDAIDDLADDILGTPDEKMMQVGSTYGKGHAWDWRSATKFEDELGNNPAFKTPPAAPVSSTPATPLLTTRL